MTNQAKLLWLICFVGAAHATKHKEPDAESLRHQADRDRVRHYEQIARPYFRMQPSANPARNQELLAEIAARIVELNCVAADFASRLTQDAATRLGESVNGLENVQERIQKVLDKQTGSSSGSSPSSISDDLNSGDSDSEDDFEPVARHLDFSSPAACGLHSLSLH